MNLVDAYTRAGLHDRVDALGTHAGIVMSIISPTVG